MLTRYYHKTEKVCKKKTHERYQDLYVEEKNKIILKCE